MANPVDLLADRAVRLLTRTGRVAAIRPIATAFDEIVVDLDGVDWEPGAKVQFRTGGMTFRTFTPFGWDQASVSFLVYHHGAEGRVEGWLAALHPGDEVQLFGPRRSLSLADLDAAPVLVGDETSLALAASYARAGGHDAAAHLFETTESTAVTAVADHLGLGPVETVTRTAGDGHLDELSRRVLALLAEHPSAPLVITGKAQTIRAVRGALKEAGVSRTVRVKAYWDPNRSGLD